MSYESDIRSLVKILSRSMLEDGNRNTIDMVIESLDELADEYEGDSDDATFGDREFFEGMMQSLMDFRVKHFGASDREDD